MPDGFHLEGRPIGWLRNGKRNIGLLLRALGREREAAEHLAHAAQLAPAP